MKPTIGRFGIVLGLGLGLVLEAKVITVTTIDNVSPPAGQTSLKQALEQAAAGDEIHFNIPGAGPHVIATPVDGYPLITVSGLSIDGYTQPGAVANSNPILGTNNAQITIVLDSRNGNSRVMDFAGDTPNDDTGYGSGESAILGVLGATNVTIRGMSLLAVPLTGAGGDVALYGISFAKGANGHVNGCWIGLHPDGSTVAGPADGVTGFRYRGRDENNAVTNTILVSGVTIGVGKGSSAPRSEFNVILGVPAIPIILEGENERISGNFLGVYPSGNRDYNVGLEPAFSGFFEGFVEIGRAGNNTVIGVDGDGENDAEERNVIGGTVPPSLGGYDHALEFYGQTPGTNVVVAGNYVGVGVDGVTRFTNGVPALNASGGTATYRFGSNLDGVSDAVEGNVVYNNWPESMFGGTSLDLQKEFFDELADSGSASVRGNVLVNNYTPPVNPLKSAGAHLTNYYARVMADVTNGVMPELSTNSSVARLVGKVPLPSAGYPVVWVDVYEADPEGIALGKAVDAAQGTTDYPEGWVQGKKFWGTLEVDGSADRDGVAGQFDFDVTSWTLPAGTALTITANYATSNAPAAQTITSLFSTPVTPRAPIMVTTANSQGAGSLSAALTGAREGDAIRFNIPGAGPHVIATPVDGYPLITVSGLSIDGYTQPGAVANSNPILGTNNAQITIVLDSRNGNSRVMDFAGDTPNDDTGYGSGESAILGVLGATNVTIRGMSLLAVPLTGAGGDVSLYGVSFAKGANGHINGCWIGVHPDGTTLAGPADGVTGFRYRGRDENNAVTNTILVSGVTIGVGKGSSAPRSEFNVILGVPAIPIILEGENERISGNFLGVYPSGNRDYNVGLEPAFSGFFEGFVEIGRAGNNTVIGVDGDGENDAEERNVIGGTVPPSLGGYDHALEFYGQTPGTNVVVAGNYVGVGVDGVTRFTNGVPALNASGGTATYRFGSNLDGVSDAVEGNVVYNNWPESMFGGTSLDLQKEFFDELADSGSASVRGNVLVNNYTPPVNPLKSAGAHLTNYYARVMADVTNGVMPELSTNSSVARLVGKVPLPSAGYPVVWVDVYEADPEGIALGKAVDAAQGTTDYPEGWVQGKKFWGTLEVDGSADRDGVAGQFDFDVTSWALPAGIALTITANYATSNAPAAQTITSLFSVPVSPAAGSDLTLTASQSGGNLTLTWSGGTPPYQVERRDNLSTGTWAPQGSAVSGNTATVPITGPQGYYRVRGQ